MIDINTASAEKIDAVPQLRGHGFEIVRYRGERGRFDALRQLEEVPGLADLLLHEIATDGTDPQALVRQLQDLAIAVRGHVAVEERIVTMCDGRLLPAQWRRAWVDGRDAILQLRADWVAFLDDWTADAITCDLDSFREEAVDMLGRLKERVRTETEAFYAVSLQTGAITFR